MLKIVIFPNPVLTQKANDIVLDDQVLLPEYSSMVGQDVLVALATEMAIIMGKAGGIGLAAPQVGISRRMFVAKMSSGETVAVVNPKLEVPDDAKPMTDIEGCLSIPGVQVQVQRPDKVRLSGLILSTSGKDSFYKNAVDSTMELSGMDARVIFHEADHLDGVLFLQRISEDDKKDMLRHIHNLSKKP